MLILLLPLIKYAIIIVLILIAIYWFKKKFMKSSFSNYMYGGDTPIKFQNVNSQSDPRAQIIDGIVYVPNTFTYNPTAPTIYGFDSKIKEGPPYNYGIMEIPTDVMY